MPIYKNVASQKLAIYAYDIVAAAAKTGDSTNITAEISLDGAASTATNDVNPTELDATDHPGIYLFDLTQAETNADLVVVSAVSSSTDVNIEPVISYPLNIPEIADQVWDEVLTGATHNVVNSAGRRLRNIQDFGIYDLASVWVDEVSGTSTGVTDGEDGTVTNRSDDFDNAQTIATSVGLDKINIQNGNTITLASSLNGFNVTGGQWTLALGGQDIGESTFENATVSGIGTGTTPRFVNCTMGTCTLPPAKLYRCDMNGTLTIGSSGDYLFSDCKSSVAGSGAPIVDLSTAVGVTTISFRRWSGGLTLNNVAAGDVISVDAISGGTITVGGTGGDVHIRGMVAVTDNSSGVTITQTQVTTPASILSSVEGSTSLAAIDTLLDRVAVTTIGNTSDAGTGTEVFSYGGNIATVTVDAAGNRTLAWST